MQEEMIHKHKVFSLAPTFHGIEKSVDDIIEEIDNFINHGDLLKAKELLLKFKSTPYIKNHLVNITIKMQKMNAFKQAYKENNFKFCYEFLDSNTFLNQSKLGLMLNQHWKKVIKQGETLALKGEIGELLQVLDHFLDVKTRKNKIGNILRVASISRIKIYLSKKDYINSKKIIYSHIDIFGYDREIASVMAMYESLSKENLAITNGQNERALRDKWKKDDILDKYHDI